MVNRAADASPPRRAAHHYDLLMGNTADAD